MSLTGRITLLQEEKTIKLNIKNLSAKPLTVSTPILMAVGIIYLLQTLFIPTALFVDINGVVLQFISLISFISAYFIYSRLINNSKSSIPLILSVVLCLVLGEAVLLLATAVSLIFSVCTLSYILGTKNKSTVKIIFSLIPVFSWLIASLLLSDPLIAALALAHIPAAILLAHSISKGYPRVSTICRISVGFIISVFAIAATCFFLKNGTDVKLLPELIANAKESLTTFYYNILSSEYASLLLYEEGMQISATDMMTIASSAVNTLFIFLPALVVTLTNILAFIVHSVTLKTLLRTQEDRAKILPMFSFDMSLLSAIVFLVSFTVSALMSEAELSVLSVGLSNIAIIFMPGLIYTAIMTFNTVLAMKPSCGGMLLYLALIFVTVNFASVMFPLVSVAGAVVIIILSITKYRLLKKKK